MRILMIDNYDSFTFNLVQSLEGWGTEVHVVRNDLAPLAELEAAAPDGVVISPGPGRPEAAGVSVEAARHFAERGIPVLGVCLGHQALAVAFGARLRRAARPAHGKTSWIRHDGRGVFCGLPSPLEATRYHSLVVDEGAPLGPLEVSARSRDGEIMGLRHLALPAEGVQFHPESVATPHGHALLGRFVAACRAAA